MRTMRKWFGAATLGSALGLSGAPALAQSRPATPPTGPATPPTGPATPPTGPATPPTGPAAPPRAAKPADATPTAEELAAARELWSIGLELEKSKGWAAALETFTKVGQVRMTPQVRYHIAFSSEHVGKLVDALNGYQLALQEARALGDKARDVLEQAPPRIEQVRARVAKLRIHVEGKVRNSVLTLDGKKLSLALLDHDIPVDPGKHLVELRRGATVVARSAIEFPEGHSETVEFRADDPAMPPSAGGDAPPNDGPAGAAGPPVDDGPSRLPAYVTGGVGAAALITSGVFFGLREWTIAQVRASCTNGDSGCDPALEPTADQGRTYTTVGGILAGVGGAALGTGAVLWLVLAPDEPTPGAAPAVALVPSLGGLRVVGTF